MVSLLFSMDSFFSYEGVNPSPAIPSHSASSKIGISTVVPK
jgi:hypothetical protein